MENNLGIIRPYGNRWVWPYTHMKPGDFFLVDAIQREPEKVRQQAYVRAAQLNKHFSVQKDDPDNPGFCRVDCVAEPLPRAGTRSMGTLEYGTAGRKLLELYGWDINTMDHSAIHYWRAKSIVAPSRYKIEQPRFVFTIASITTVGVEMDEKGFTLVPLPHGWTLKHWENEYERWHDNIRVQQQARLDEDKELENKIVSNTKNSAIYIALQNPEITKREAIAALFE